LIQWKIKKNRNRSNRSNRSIRISRRNRRNRSNRSERSWGKRLIEVDLVVHPSLVSSQVLGHDAEFEIVLQTRVNSEMSRVKGDQACIGGIKL
jgi:hypothetical protein